VVVQVAATALNRADLLQVRGLYPPPPGESLIPGLECSGIVESVSPDVEEWNPGDRVMALLAGGGHAQRVAAPAGQVMALPVGMGFHQGAALPEAAVTSWVNLAHEGGLQAGEIVLITAAASGVGSFAVQLARECGARVLVAGRNMERLDRLRPLGAEECLPLGPALPALVREATGERGADLVFDMVGGGEMANHLACLGVGGRLVLVGLLGGARAQLDLALVLRRRLRLVGSVLRLRTRQEKAQLVAAFAEFGGPRLSDGRLRPVIDRVVPFSEISAAYQALEAGGIFGKIVIAVDPEV
jgi:putative PIG3 family NAD(P)H quinone oxidoreductase